MCVGDEKERKETNERTLVTKTTLDSVLQIQHRRSSQMKRRRATQVEHTSLCPHAPYDTHSRLSAHTAQLSSILNLNQDFGDTEEEEDLGFLRLEEGIWVKSWEGLIVLSFFLSSC